MSISDRELIEAIELIIDVIEEEEIKKNGSDILELCSKSSIFYKELDSNFQLSAEHIIAINEMKLNHLLKNIENNCPFNKILIPKLDNKMLKKLSEIYSMYFNIN